MSSLLERYPCEIGAACAPDCKRPCPMNRGIFNRGASSVPNPLEKLLDTAAEFERSVKAGEAIAPAFDAIPCPGKKYPPHLTDRDHEATTGTVPFQGVTDTFREELRQVLPMAILELEEKANKHESDADLFDKVPNRNEDAYRYMRAKVAALRSLAERLKGLMNHE